MKRWGWVTLAICLAVALPAHARQECHYECTEYYPNGTDCKKTRKVCVEVPDIKTDDLTPPTQNCASADGKVFKCN